MESLHGRSVLVVDDDVDTLELYASSLARVDARVERANSVDAALEVMTGFRPDVVLCDLHLPGRDGYALLEAMRADRALAAIPVIAISGSHPEVERDRSLSAGFADHFVKPTKLRDLVAAIAQLSSAR